jgi:hypothetical protein
MLGHWKSSTLPVADVHYTEALVHKRMFSSLLVMFTLFP